MLFEHDCEAAEKNPRIVAFMTAVREAAGDAVFTQRMFQEPEFSSFWPNSVITRHVEERDDYLFVLVGGELVAMGGRDMTGKYISEGNYARTEADLRKYNADVIREGRTIYCCGSIDIKNQEYKSWHQVKLPFEMSGKLNQTLGYTVFEKEQNPGASAY